MRIDGPTCLSRRRRWPCSLHRLQVGLVLILFTNSMRKVTKRRRKFRIIFLSTVNSSLCALILCFLLLRAYLMFVTLKLAISLYAIDESERVLRTVIHIGLFSPTDSFVFRDIPIQVAQWEALLQCAAPSYTVTYTFLLSIQWKWS